MIKNSIRMTLLAFLYVFASSAYAEGGCIVGSTGTESEGEMQPQVITCDPDDQGGAVVVGTAPIGGGSSTGSNGSGSLGSGASGGTPPPPPPPPQDPPKSQRQICLEDSAEKFARCRARVSGEYSTYLQTECSGSGTVSIEANGGIGSAGISDDEYRKCKDYGESVRDNGYESCNVLNTRRIQACP